MIKTVADTVDFIESRKKFGSKPGLERINHLLDQLHHPEKNLTFIHIAGTNGKGSTVSFLANMLEKSGLTVGTFTSPYIENFNERISLDGKPISDEALTKVIQVLEPFVKESDELNCSLTEFELVTAAAFLYFKEKKPDVVILEVGLGGLLDSTNVVFPILTAITTIGLDHTAVLGDTIEEIAAQKAGIIKNNVPLVTGNITPAAKAVIDHIAAEKKASVAHFGQSFEINYKGPDPKWGEQFDFTNENGKINQLYVPLLGRHQVENAALAIELFYLSCQKLGLPFSDKPVRQGLAAVTWPARMEKVSQEPLIVLDGAHNPHAMGRLVENIKNEFQVNKVYVLFSALERKDITTMIKQLLTISHAEIYLTSFDFPEALQLEKNYQEIDTQRIRIASLWQFGFASILEQAQPDDLILITGSLYFISEVRGLIKDLI
ncbi:MAG TPA: folylpolyglutamate synthase/dihydrofolate synthase family protein [Tetragenococcus sp.]|nr:folylpolyglutamate synthase/dihydrofolate synthase family protein [Tetragenococcus sp.]